MNRLPFLFVRLIAILAISVISAVEHPAAAATADEREQLPSLIASLRVNKPLSFCGEAVPIQNADVRERFERELLLSLWNRPQAILWIKRAHRYMPYIDEQLKKNDMPPDLKYVVIAESGLLSYAGSPKGAMGYWQFMEGTAKNCNLTVNNHIDERRNIFASTDAAILYLNKIYRMFHSWTLAVAAYNMGEEGLKSEILIQKVNDYYKLYLPMETQRYIFRIIAAKLIIENPLRYGFDLKTEDLYAPLAFDRITFSCDDNMPVQIVAEAAGADYKVIKDLNPQIRGYYLHKGDHTIAVPKGAAASFADRFAKLTAQWRADIDKNSYTVKSGDTLTGIAAQFNVPLPALLIWNRMGKLRKLMPGERLFVYRKSIDQQDSMGKK